MKNTPEFLTKLRFLPVKSPCENAYFYTDKLKDNVFLKWTPGGITKEIKGQEIKKFTIDTKELLDTYCGVFVSASSKDNNRLGQILNTVDSLTCTYWKTWGPLIPSKKKGIIPILNLIDIGFNYYIILIFWGESSDLEFLPIKDLLQKIQIRTGDPSLPTPLYWHPLFDFSERELLTWIPLDRKEASEYIKYSGLTLLFKHPNKRELEGLICQIKTQEEWVRENILQCISRYIDRQKIYFKASIKGEEIHFTGETKSLFLAFLMNEIIITGRGKIELCECGCGKPIPPGRIRWATDKCDEKSPRKKISHWLKTRKGRGQLFAEEYNSIMKEVDELIDIGKSEKEIRGIIMPKAIKKGE